MELRVVVIAAWAFSTVL